jgi:proteasome lid subunit RPN8/RPN11
VVAPRITKLTLTLRQKRQLYGIRRRAAPHEGVALLLGTYEHKRTCAKVIRISEMENVAQSSSTFAIDPEHHYVILTAAIKDNLEQVGIYHSHPAPPYPSGWDLEYMEYNPCVWIIDGIVGSRHQMRAYQLIDGEVYEVQIQTILE